MGTQLSAPNFRPMSVVAKRLDGSRCHLVLRYASVQATSCEMGTQLAPKRGTAAPPFSSNVYCSQIVAHLRYCWALVCKWRDISSQCNFTQYAVLPHNIEIVLWPEITVTLLHRIHMLHCLSYIAVLVHKQDWLWRCFQWYTWYGHTFLILGCMQLVSHTGLRSM